MDTLMLRRGAEPDPFAAGTANGDRETVKPGLRVMENAWFDAPARRTSRPPPRPSAPPIGDAFADEWFR